ncbi:hypothetical protein EVAR_66722_1 [Eumeta japonica]|uniref:Uncharacterized protein n=1 Tax=Eumeta variegata TaxID=151549 RepID=A0A4C2A1M1_EUMVA|nr:hypothetical protein EVAR_66722_1 [Eumeta japonica]
MGEWQHQYTEGNTGEIPKCFFPRVEKAQNILQQIGMMSQMSQTLTNHGGLSQYLFRFRLQDSPHYACDPAEIQDVLHVLEECDMFFRERVALEAEIDVRVGRRHFPEIFGHVKHTAADFVTALVTTAFNSPRPTLELYVVVRGPSP